jgi:serine/threonine protein kinase
VIGETLDGKYRIDAPLGRGGMGTVYVATHLGTGREVALKVLVPELTANEAAVERFRREARTAGQLRHPNVVDVTDFGFAERGDRQVAYLVMELLRGRTLRALLDAERTLPVDVAIDVLDQVCNAVGAAHAQGILHRDLKPENIHVEKDARGRYRVRVLDFGIAKLVHEGNRAAAAVEGEARVRAATSVLEEAATLPAIDATGPTPPADVGTAPTALALHEGGSTLTRAGAIIGTPRYMSPEQWRGEDVDERADVYSLSVVAYEMLAGEPPFGDSGAATARGGAPEAFGRLRENVPSVPPFVARAIAASLDPDPGKRAPTAAALAASLRAGTETTAKLLVRSFVIGYQNYFTLFRRCAPMTVPGLLAVAASFVAALLGYGRDLGHFASVFWKGAFGTVMGFSVLAGFAIGGLLVPFVADVIATGSSRRAPPTLTVIVATAWRAMPTILATIALIVTCGALGRALALRISADLDRARTIALLITVVIGAPALSRFSFGASVVAVEGVRGLRPLARSVALTRPMWRSAVGVQLFFVVWTTVLPVLGVAALKAVAGPRAAGTVLEMPQLFGVVSSLLSALIAPFSFLPPALLYLRAREAEGDPVPV